jgi:hypothetical protein
MFSCVISIITSKKITCDGVASKISTEAYHVPLAVAMCCLVLNCGGSIDSKSGYRNRVPSTSVELADVRISRIPMYDE